MTYIAGSGSSSAKIMLVGDWPRSSDSQEEQALNSSILRQIIQQAGGSYDETYRTYLYKYRVFDNKAKNLSEEKLKQSKAQLDQEVLTIRPNVIVPLGDLALSYFRGGLKGKLADWRGSILQSTKYSAYTPKVIATHHPSQLLWSAKNEGFSKLAWSAKTYITLDFKRIIEESKTNYINLPARQLQICRNSPMLHEFIQRYSDRSKFNRVAIDIETIKCIPVLIGLAFSKSHAMSIPLLNLKGNSANIQLSSYDLATIWKMVAEILYDPTLGKIGQNFKFDDQKLTEVCGFQIRNVVSDTMFKAHLLHAELPKKLGFLTSIYTREPYYKDEGKEFNPAKDKFDQFAIYNAKDAATTFEIDEAMEPALDHYGCKSFYYDYVMKLHPLYMHIERQGFKIDFEKRKELNLKYTIWRDNTQTDLDLIAGHPVNTNSPVAVKRLLYKELGIPERADSSEETLCALLANVELTHEQRNAIENVYTLRRVKRALIGINAKPDYDGRLRTSIRIVGTETSRSTNGIIDAPVRPDELGFPFNLLSKHGEFGPDMRKQYIAEDGEIFMNFDLSQAEARIVALLSEDYEMLEMFDTIDIHAKTAEWVFGGEYKDHVKNKETGEEPPTRFGGKTVRHAGNYGMGKHTLMLDATSKARRFHINLTMSEKSAGECLKKFHAKSPKIQGVFHVAVAKALKDGKRVLYNAYGRPRLFLDQDGQGLLREAFAQIPQSSVADKLKTALIAIHTKLPDIPIIVEAHDAATFRVPIPRRQEVYEIVKEEFEKPLPFGDLCSIKRDSLIIPCDCEEGYNYKDLKKIKFNLAKSI